MKNYLFLVICVFTFSFSGFTQPPPTQNINEITTINLIKSFRDLINLTDLTRQCLKDSIEYDSLSFFHKKIINDLPNQIIKFYEEKLDSSFSKELIRNRIGSNLSYIQDHFFQRAALAVSSGTNIKTQDSLDLCLLCLDIIRPKNSVYLLEEDKSFEISFDSTFTPSSTANTSTGFKDFFSFQLNKDQWFEISGRISAKAKWNSWEENTKWLNIPTGTQICDFEYNISGRGNYKIKLKAYSPRLESTSDHKLPLLTVTARADGANEWHDQKSASCTIDFKKIRLVPLSYTEIERTALGCKTFPIRKYNKTWKLNGKVIPFEEYLNQSEEKKLTKTDLTILPEEYPF